MTRVLVVDDDPTVREVVAGYLIRAGLLVDQADDGPAALAQAAAEPPDVVVLDLMLPGLEGLEVLRRLRARRGDLPVVLLTARGEEDDRILGLQVGADDYVTKPYRLRELVARVRAVLRRRSGWAEQAPRDDEVIVGDVSINVDSREVHLGGNLVPLPLKEYELLLLLMENAGRVLTRGTIIDRVWGYDYVGDTKTLDVHVKRLRAKLEDDPAAPVRLLTVRGVGYKYAAA